MRWISVRFYEMGDTLITFSAQVFHKVIYLTILKRYKVDKEQKEATLIKTSPEPWGKLQLGFKNIWGHID